MKIMPFKEADALFDGELSKKFQHSYGRALVIQEDLYLEGDFLAALEKIQPGDVYPVIVVNGNVTVKGRIKLYDANPGLYVSGFIRAETLEGGDCEIYIKDAKLDYFAYGEHNNGTLRAEKIEAPFIIDYEHDFVFTPVNAKIVNYWSDNAEKVDFNNDNIPTSFIAEVLNRDDPKYLDIEKLYTRLKGEKPVLMEGALTLKEKKQKRIKKAAKKKVKHLDLSEEYLESIPEHVLQMDGLKSLDLGYNSLKEIPPDIGNLKALKELILDDCDLITLPDEIGALKNLRRLSVAGNVRYVPKQTPDRIAIKIPQSIQQCGALEELDISGLSSVVDTDKEDELDYSPYYLQESVGNLPNLQAIYAENTNVVFPPTFANNKTVRKLVLEDVSYTGFKSLADILTMFQGLKSLNISNNKLYEIPKAIQRLTELEELDVSCSLSVLKKPIPDFSVLPKLKKLNFNGNSEYEKLPSLDKLDQLLAMELNTLEELTLNYWCSDGYERTDELQPEQLQNLGKFTNLRKISLSHNNLGYLPDSFYSLTKLEEINLERNHLPRTQRQRIIEAFPDAKIDLRRQDVEEEEEQKSDKTYQQIKKIINKADKFRKDWDFLKALKQYDKALNKLKKGGIDGCYEQLYCLYGKAYIHGQIGYQLGKVSKKDKAEHQKLGFGISKQALSLLPKTGIWHYTDEGQFHLEVSRFCGNYVAWYLKDLATGPDDPKLEEALEIIEQSADAVEEEEHQYVMDTKVRLLLAMNRTDEAYETTYKILLKYPQFEDLRDVANSKKYQTWLKDKL